ncbi:MAG: ATP phosphoribosyltransferase regulatory subunit [Coriobacteriia bacterium]|nr:ATP phosphoribosyltransferase regulatory subunit [Coriobacteriia bacterium]MBN2848546.1 ATP phosphoribosyltransferase regulatory subunit [Coriobacteriia bacterium]
MQPLQPLVPVTPRGFRDVLFEEARERETVVGALSAVFSAWGYDPVETPVVEESSTLQTGIPGEIERSAFRLFDLDGSLLALRPELTVPIARLTASRLAGTPGPHRVRYATEVFREHASLRGQARQFTQVGVEFIGARGPAADTEVVLLLIAALEAAGLRSYVIGLGTAEVLRALLEKAGGPEEWREAMIAAAQSRNLVEIERLAAREDLDPELTRAFIELPRIKGGREAFEGCQALATACACDEVACSLRETWRVLDELGYGDRIQVDFGIMRSLDYYTGLQVEAYAPGLGLPLAGGGRYDRLLSAFGHPAPAAGFAIGLERLMIALAEQSASPRLEPLDAVLGGRTPAEVFRAAIALRDAGWRVRLATGRVGTALVREADDFGALEALVVEGEAIVRVDRTGEPARSLGDPLPEPPRRTWAAKGGDVR